MDAFINELASSNIQQRLLENCMLDLQSANRKTLSLDLANKNSEADNNMATNHVTTTTTNSTEEQHYGNISSPFATSFSQKKLLPIYNKKSWFFLW